DAVGALAEAGDVRRGKRVFDVAIVGQHIDRDHRAGFSHHGNIVVRHRRLVDRGNGDVDRRRGDTAGAVVEGIGEAVAGGLGAVVGVGERAVAVVDDDAVGTLAEAADVPGGQHAFSVAVIGQHVGRDYRATFGNRGGIVVGQRGVVDRRDRDIHR